MAETVRDVVFRLKIELAEAAMKAPEVRPVIEAQEKMKKGYQDTAREAEKAAQNGSATYERESKRIGDILRKDYERGRTIREREARERERDADRAIQAAERAAQQQARAAEKSAQLQEKAFFKVSGAMTKAADGALSVAKGLALMSVSGEKDSEKMLRGFIRITAGIDAIKGTLAIYKAVTEAIRAATVAQMALNAAQAGGGAMGAMGKGGMLGVGARLLSGVGPMGLIAAGTAAGLGGIAAFHQPTREGLGELIGFSDMAGDEAERAARRVAQGEAYNRGLAMDRSTRQQIRMLQIERDSVNMRPLEKTEFSIGKLTEAARGTDDLMAQRDIMRDILNLRQQHVALIEQQLKGQRDAVQVTKAELEAKQRFVGSGALGYLNLSQAEQRQTVSSVEKLRGGGQQLSVKELNSVSRVRQFIGPESEKLLDQQSLALAVQRGFKPIADPVLQGMDRLQYQLAAQSGALDKTVQQYGTNIAEIRTKIMQAIYDPLIKQLEDTLGAINLEAARRARQSAGSSDGGPTELQALVKTLQEAPWFAVPKSPSHRPRTNGQ